MSYQKYHLDIDLCIFSKLNNSNIVLSIRVKFILVFIIIFNIMTTILPLGNKNCKVRIT